MAIELRNIDPVIFLHDVGIGTTSPNTRLHVTTSGGNQMILEDSAAGLNLKKWILNSEAGTLGVKLANDAFSSSQTFVSVLSSGNVGIGTTSPATKLDVRDTAPVFRLQETTTGGDKRLEFGVTSAGLAWIGANQSAQDLTFQTVGSEKIRITSAGNVGIGTTSPSARLDVYSATNLGAGANGIRVQRPGSYGQYGYLEYLVSSDMTVLGSLYTGGGAGAFGQLTFRQHSSTTSRDAMVLDSSGNVGIGTSSPTQKLNVTGGNIGVDAASRKIGYIDDDAVHQGYITPYSSTGTLDIHSTFTTGGIKFFTGTGDSERVRIDSSGNVGIGTTNPLYHVMILRRAGSTITQPLLNLQSQTSSSVDGDSFILYGTQAANWSAGVDQADSNKFRIEPSMTLGGATGLTIDTSGKVGIGTAAPSEKLHVEGHIKLTGSLKFSDGSSFPNAGTTFPRTMACPIDGARGVYDNDVLWLWDGTYRTVNESQYYIGTTESHATNGGSATVLGVLTTTGGGTFSDQTYYTTTWGDNYMIGVTTAASSVAPTTWVTATLPCDPSVHNVLHVKVISTDRWQIVGAYILNSAGALQSKLQSHGNAKVDDSYGDISTVGPRNSAAKNTCCHEWVSIIIPKAHLTSHAYANANSPTGYSVKIALYNGDSRGSSLYISGLGISRNPTGFVHVNAIDLYWATNGGGATGWRGSWNRDSMNLISDHTNYSDIRIPIAGTDRDILIGAVDHGDNSRVPGSIFWLQNYNQPGIPNATFYLSSQITGTYGKTNIGYKYRGFSGFVVPKALVQAYAQTYLGQQYLSFYIYNLRNSSNVHFRAMYSEQVNRIGNSKSITGAAFNMKNNNYASNSIVDLATYDGG